MYEGTFHLSLKGKGEKGAPKEKPDPEQNDAGKGKGEEKASHKVLSVDVDEAAAEAPITP